MNLEAHNRQSAPAFFTRLTGLWDFSPSPPVQALTAGLSSALHILLLAGDAAGPAAERAAAAAVSRCGAGGLQAEVAALAVRLRAVAAVVEAVHQPCIEVLAADLA